MRQISEDTHALGTRGHDSSVLRGSDRATVVDAGCCGVWVKLVHGSESIGLSLEAVAETVVTHSHADTMDLIDPARGPQVIERRFDLDHEQALASLDRIVDVDAGLRLPGHGVPRRGSPAEAVALSRRS